MSLYPLEKFGTLDMKITKFDMQAIVTGHFDERKVCVDIQPVPKKNPTHYVIRLINRASKEKQ